MATMLSPLLRALQVGARRTAVTCLDVEFTYDETWERCRHLVGALDALGVGEGDRVAVVGPNSHQYLELYQAIPGCGCCIVPLNARHTVAELRYALEDSATKLLFTAVATDELRDGVEHVVELGDGYEVLLRDAKPVDPLADLPEHTLAGLFYTGGTTGKSKGVMLTHGNLLANFGHNSRCSVSVDVIDGMVRRGPDGEHSVVDSGAIGVTVSAERRH